MRVKRHDDNSSRESGTEERFDTNPGFVKKKKKIISINRTEKQKKLMNGRIKRRNKEVVVAKILSNNYSSNNKSYNNFSLKLFIINN